MFMVDEPFRRIISKRYELLQLVRNVFNPKAGKLRGFCRVAAYLNLIFDLKSSTKLFPYNKKVIVN